MVVDGNTGDNRDAPIVYYVDDDIGNYRHKQLDKALLNDDVLDGNYDDTKKPKAAILLRLIVEYSDDKLDKKYTNQSIAKSFLELNKHIATLLMRAWEAKDFKAIRLLFLRPQEEIDYYDEAWHVKPQQKATVRSWNVEYKGPAAKDLWNFIRNEFSDATLEPYARYTAIVQSSGMGKSRAVDEMSKEHFVIPMCLRKGRSGFPPPDSLVRDYLCVRNSRNTTYKKAVAFLSALFEHTANEVHQIRGLKEFTGGQVAAEFRDRMTGGQTFTKYGKYRSDFFSAVVENAEERIHNLPDLWSSSTVGGGLLAECFAKLADALPKVSHLDKVEPLVILAFDEAHVLSSVNDDGESTILGEMQRAIRLLKNSSVFTVFLSTTGKITQLRENNVLAMARGNLRLIRPFSDLGFDQLVKPIQDNVWTINDIAKEDFMAQLGRPLFASRYTEGSKVVKAGIVLFAGFKLFNGSPLDVKVELDKHQRLACLSRRLPFEFCTTRYLDQDEMQQVEAHMRVCLRMDVLSQSMKSVSSSEPILSEAAFAIMQQENFHPAKALAAVFSDFSVGMSKQVEFVGLLLMILARDGAVSRQNDDKKSLLYASEFSPTEWNRVVSVFDFVKQLFNCDKLFVGSMEGQLLLKAFKKDFENSVFHFNHFIKGHDHELVQLVNILPFLIRGAGLFCGNSHMGVDAIVPILRNKDARISEWIIDLCLVYFKADSSSATPDWELYDAMDPYDLEIITKEEKPMNCIRIVFALAAKTPALEIRRTPLQSVKHGEYVCYDIWCAGLYSSVLPPVEDEKAWASLRQWVEFFCTYEMEGEWVDARAKQNPLAGIDKSFHSWFFKQPRPISPTNDPDGDNNS